MANNIRFQKYYYKVYVFKIKGNAITAIMQLLQSDILLYTLNPSDDGMKIPTTQEIYLAFLAKGQKRN